MRKRIIALCVALLGSLPLVAQTTADEWLAKLDMTLGSRYATHITVTTPEGATLVGYYMVEGDGYYLTLGVMEVFSDGKLRYEVNNERKEVTEDRVDINSVDLLSNPTRAFDFVDSEFEVSVARNTSDGVELLLVPRNSEYGITEIHLTLQRDNQGGVLPREVVYHYDGDRIAIALTLADIEQTALPRWGKSDYRAYDIVSFL